MFCNLGEWSNDNLRSIINTLKCFHLASGLHINIHKSQLLGVGVPQVDVETTASSIDCSIINDQFRYLGVTVGDNMSRHKAWAGVILKLRSRLSKWKSKTLSIGGRLMLLKSVLDASPLYFLEVCFGRWIFMVLCHSSYLRDSYWLTFDSYGLNLEFDYAGSSFVKISSISGNGSFNVKDIRNTLDDRLLPSWPEPTRWVKSIPIKINVFTWRARRDCLPTKSNLIRKGYPEIYMQVVGIGLAAMVLFFRMEPMVFEP
nr:hypothetical protein [Tanacetum cinerariifolium]